MLKLGAGAVLLSFFLATISARRIGRDFEDDSVDRGNKYVDDMVRDFLDVRSHEFEPYSIPDSIISFSKKVLFVNVTGEAKLHKGYITGLSSLHRPDNCYLTTENGRIHIRADLGAGVIDGYYSGTVAFMSYGPTITVHFKVPYLEVTMKASIDKETGRGGKLHEFHFDEMRGMKVDITGLGPLNWIASYLINSIAYLFNGYLRNFFEKYVEAHIRERIGDYQFPGKGEL